MEQFCSWEWYGISVGVSPVFWRESPEAYCILLKNCEKVLFQVLDFRTNLFLIGRQLKNQFLYQHWNLQTWLSQISALSLTGWHNGFGLPCSIQLCVDSGKFQHLWPSMDTIFKLLLYSSVRPDPPICPCRLTVLAISKPIWKNVNETSFSKISLVKVVTHFVTFTDSQI